MHKFNIAPAAPVPTRSEKTVLRERLLALRAALDVELRDLAQVALAARLLDLFASAAPGTIAVYWPIRGEPDLADAWRALLDAGRTLALPVVETRGSTLAFRRWDGHPPAALDACRVRVPPPESGSATPSSIVIPCLGFNRDGYRLGYGGGYYDRSFAHRPERPRLIGVAFDLQACEFAPDAHDLQLDAVVTERRTYLWR